MAALIAQGYPFEIAGLMYYLFFLLMVRGARKERFSQRTRVVTLVAAIVLVASVPLRYAGNGFAQLLMYGLAALALVSTFADRARAQRG